MLLSSWRSLFHTTTSSALLANRRHLRRFASTFFRRLSVEALEERLAPASAFFNMPTTGLTGGRGTDPTSAVTVPIRIDHLSETGTTNQGLSGVDVVLLYDKNVLTVANSDVSAGTLLTTGNPGDGSGGTTWTFSANAAVAGELDFSSFSGGQDVTSATGGVLANIVFHIKPNAATGNTTIAVAPPAVSISHKNSDATDSVNVASYNLDPPVNGIINVTNTAPVAVVDAYSTPENKTLTVSTTTAGLLANDTDANGDTLTVGSVNGAPASVGTQVPTAKGGLVTVSQNGTFVYIPPTGYNSNVSGPDSFTYQASDGTSLSNTATVTLTVTTTLSIPTTLSSSPSSTVVVPLNLDNPDPAGRTGMVSADAALLFDPNIFTVSTTAGQNGLGTNATASVTFGGTTTGGTFTLTVNGTATAPITWSATPTTLQANIQAALNAVSSVGFTDGIRNSVVTGAGPFTITFQNKLGGGQTVAISANGSGLTGTSETVVAASSNTPVSGPTVIAGSVIPAVGWTVTANIDTTGANGVDLTQDAFGLHIANTNNTPITTTASGGLWLITFPLKSTAATGTTAINLVPHALVGASTTTTNVSDLSGAYPLNPAPTNAANDPGVDGVVTVQNLNSANHFTIAAPTSANAGQSFTYTVTAINGFNATATTYTGTVHFTSTDAGAGVVLPADATLTNGVGTFTATLVTAGTQTITATDTTTGNPSSGITGTSNNITVAHVAANHYVFSATPSNATAGTQFSYTVTAADQFGNTDTGYAGTVHFTSSDSQAVLPANTTLTSGVGTFNATLKTAGNQTLTATDTATSSITGVSSAITVSAIAATHYTVSAPATAVAGTSFAYTVTAQDPFGNTDKTYAGTVHFTSNDPAGTLPADSVLTNGTGSFNATLDTAGNRTITATDTVTNTITGVSGTIAVSAAAATHYLVTAPPSATAGTSFFVTVTAEDQFNNTATGYTGTVHFTSTDAQATLPGNTTLTSGVGAVSATLKTAGNQTITATDTVTNTINGVSNTVAVSAAAASHYTVTAPSSATAGVAFNFLVAAVDPFNNVATTYAGTVHFTSSDGQAVLPANTVLSSGTGTLSATLKTAGNQTLTATDTATSSITGVSNAITVSPAAATHYTVSAPSTATAGVAFSYTVTALDAFNNTATGYTGTVHFTSSDATAVLPADTTLTNGAGTLNATLKTAGNQTLTATDTVTNTITGVSGAITVSAAAATHYTVSAPSTATAGVAFSYTVTALDQFNNTATGYTGTVHFTSSDGQAVLPANTTLTSGVGTLSATLKTAGIQTLTATDTTTGTITGISNPITITAANATHFTVSAPASATAGSAFSITVMALDAFGNTAITYLGTVHFTKSDSGTGSAVPADYTFVAGDTGVHIFTNGVTLVTAGNQTVTATDTTTSTITGASNAIAVSAAAATHYTVTAPPGATILVPFNFTVTAADQFNNTATGYTGTVHFTSSGGTGTLPADGTLTNGTGTFSATFNTSGPHTLTATDTVTASITGASGNIQVSAPATHFSVSAPAAATAGVSFSITVTALDVTNSTANGYTGTVHFTSTDIQAGLPADGTLTSGVGTFSVTLKTAGNQTLTATDTANSTLTGTSSAISVVPSTLTHYVVGVPTSTTAGAAFTVTVTAKDAFGNTTPTYNGTVHVTSSDPQAVLPTDSTLTNGTGSFSTTLKTSGNQTLTATDTVTNTITGTNSLVVSAAAATHYTVTAPSFATAGQAFNFTVTAQDAFSNTATSYTGTVQFTSSDSQAVVPGNTTLTNGTGTFNATLRTAATETITATDATTSSITGVSGPINVAPAAATHFQVIAAASSTAGTAFNYTVTALDAFNNKATLYNGTVHFTSSDTGTGVILPANATLTNGLSTFSATLVTAGNQTLTATDTTTSSITGHSGAIAVSAAAATHYTVTAPSAATAGAAFSFTVTAKDAFGNTATGYTGTVHFTSTDSQAVLPTDSVLTSGTGSFTATLKIAGNQTLTATDTVTGSITGVSGVLAVSAAGASHFTVTAPSSAAAGTAFTYTVTALDPFSNLATGYTGSVHFTSSDSQAVLPANTVLTNGSGSFSATLKTAGSQTLTATDTATSSITGVSGAIAVSTNAATHFTVSAPSTATAGTTFTFTVTAQDVFNNTVTGYTGTVHFTSSDSQASLPVNTTLVSGVGTFQATLKTAGSQTLTATDTTTSSITAVSGAIAVSTAAASHFTVTAPSAATGGTAFSYTVTALDPFSNTVTGYTGTVHFSSSDGRASLPGNSTLTNGTGTFLATLNTGGSQTLSATDTVTSTITGNSAAITVTVTTNTATHFSVSIPTTATAGNSFSITVTALDSSNNPATGYTGTVHFTSSDGQAVLPANATLTNGVSTFSVTLKTAGSQTVTVADTNTASLTGTSNASNVSPAAATHYSFTTPTSATAGTPFTYTVTALDAFGNTATNYTGLIHFTSSDSQAVLPTDNSVSNGVGTFTATLKTAGNQTLTATDSVTSSITSTSNAISVVSTATATHFSVTAPSTVTAGTSFTVTVTALDANNSTVPGYAGTVHLTSSDSGATLPADATLTNGVGTFIVTLVKAGSQTVTATDTVTSSFTGISNTITVTAGAVTQFKVTAPASVASALTFSVTVTAEDAFGNTVPGYTGTVHLSSNDTQANLPSNNTLTNGVGTFNVAYRNLGSQTLTATDTVTNSITGKSSTIVVQVTTLSGAGSRVGVFRSSDATWTLDTQGNLSYQVPPDLVFQFGLAGDTAISGDWSGQGVDDIGTWRVDTTVTDPISGKHPLFFTLDVNGDHILDGGDQSFYFGLQGDQVVIGDWNGDGKDTVGVVRPNASGVLVWSLDFTGNHNFVVDTFGLAGDQAVVGNWNGQGKTEIGTVRSDGVALTWSLDTNGNGIWDGTSGGDQVFVFGLANDKIFVGDWNGNGKTKIGTARALPNGGYDFSIDMNGTGVPTIYSFGQAGDTPLIGQWLGNGVDQIGTYRSNDNAVDLLFAQDLNGNGSFGAGDFGSVFGRGNDQVLVGKWYPPNK